MAQGIDDAIERVEEWKRDKNAAFFESISQRAGAIAGSIERRNTVTDNQRKALDNMLSGVRKWLNEDD